jgi:hypothetical protein
VSTSSHTSTFSAHPLHPARPAHRHRDTTNPPQNRGARVRVRLAPRGRELAHALEEAGDALGEVAEEEDEDAAAPRGRVGGCGGGAGGEVELVCGGRPGVDVGEGGCGGGKALVWMGRSSVMPRQPTVGRAVRYSMRNRRRWLLWE